MMLPFFQLLKYYVKRYIDTVAEEAVQRHMGRPGYVDPALVTVNVVGPCFWVIEQFSLDFYGPFNRLEEAERLVAKIAAKSRIYKATDYEKVKELHQAFLSEVSEGKTSW